MDSNTYYKDGIARVLEVLKDTFGDYFKAYIEGISDEVPATLMPCIMADTSDGTVAAGATGTDNIEEVIKIIVIFNEKDYLGADGMTNMASVQLRRKILGQDPTTRQYLSQTIMYALRTNFTLEDGVVNNNVSFDFYPAQRGTQLYTREAELTLRIRRMALVPQRD